MMPATPIRPTLMTPVDLADELAALRAEMAQIRAALASARPDSGWMTVPDAAKHYQCSPATINRWVREGRMEAKGHGKAREVRKVQ